MRIVMVALGIAMMVMSFGATAEAEQISGGTRAGAPAQFKAANGQIVQGKVAKNYAGCVRGGTKKLGYSAEAAASYCASRYSR
jgi:hypothetical protein